MYCLPLIHPFTGEQIGEAYFLAPEAVPRGAPLTILRTVIQRHVIPDPLNNAIIVTLDVNGMGYPDGNRPLPLDGPPVLKVLINLPPQVQDPHIVEIDFGWFTFIPIDGADENPIPRNNGGGHGGTMEGPSRVSVSTNNGGSPAVRIRVSHGVDDVMFFQSHFNRTPEAGPRSRQRECGFCRSNGERPSVFRSHGTRDGNGIVTCPVLRALVCNICGGTGDNAHTVRYCPFRRRNR